MQPAALQVNYKNWIATAGADYLGWIGADAVPHPHARLNARVALCRCVCSVD
jgi:hypothetical protein